MLRRITTAVVAIGLVFGLGIVTTGAANAVDLDDVKNRLAPPPCGKKARACVDISRGKAWLMYRGVVTYGPVDISSGMKGHRSDIGIFHVTRKHRHHTSSIYGIPMPYSVFYNGGEAFHQGSLKEKSHGCIHLERKAAKKFYKKLDIGERVRIHK